MLPLVEGFLLSSTGVILMLLFEFCISMDDVKRFRAREGGKELHAAGIFATIFNHLLFGPCTYYLTIHYGFINKDYDRTLWQQAYSVVMFLDASSTVSDPQISSSVQLHCATKFG